MRIRITQLSRVVIFTQLMTMKKNFSNTKQNDGMISMTNFDKNAAKGFLKAVVNEAKVQKEKLPEYTQKAKEVAAEQKANLPGNIEKAKVVAAQQKANMPENIDKAKTVAGQIKRGLFK